MTTVLDLTSPAVSGELTQIQARLHIVTGLLDALGRVNEVNKIIQFSQDRSVALLALQHEPFRYTPGQAEAVLDMPLSSQASDASERLRVERDKLQRRRAALREHVMEALSLHWFG
ncbi:MAG TPA: DNA gyrase subunit A [Acidimicrobiales bacterium]|nr:DNA gyrase subunit A [Acidimicrobiales bacterium]